MKKIMLRASVFGPVLALLMVGMAFAESQSTPAGPWITPSQEISLEGFESYEQLTAKLMQIEKRRQHLINLIGITNDVEFGPNGLVKTSSAPANVIAHVCRPKGQVFLERVR